MCIQLTNTCQPSDINRLLRPLLDDIQKISVGEKYYHISTNLSSLLRKVANAVVNACAKYLSLHDIFEGDALFSIKKLLDCHGLITEFKLIYKEICEHKIWENDNSVIASCDAFSQRCVDL